MLIGQVAHVELTSDSEDGGTIAACAGHIGSNPLDSRLIRGCLWTEVYDDLNDASEYAADHADTGRMDT